MASIKSIEDRLRERAQREAGPRVDDILSLWPGLGSDAMEIVDELGEAVYCNPGNVLAALRMRLVSEMAAALEQQYITDLLEAVQRQEFLR
jgi:hypothetical protein